MKAFKLLVCPGLIVLGVLVGISLSLEYGGGFFLGGAILGGVLVGLIYSLIKFVLSRWTDGSLPYDSLGERNQVRGQVDTQTTEARISETRDRIIGENMPRYPY